MAWSVTADPSRFEEALAWFVERFPRLAPIVEAWAPETYDRAFQVAGITELQVTVALWLTLVDAIDQGQGLDEWRAHAKRAIGRWRLSSDRLETVFRNNIQSAYNRGRWHQMNDPRVRRVRPFLLYDAVLDSRTTVDICRPLDGAVAHREDAFWRSHHPPLHHRCRSALRALTPRQAERRGVTDVAELNALPSPDEDFGELPTMGEFPERLHRYPPDLAEAYKRRKARGKGQPTTADSLPPPASEG